MMIIQAPPNMHQAHCPKKANNLLMRITTLSFTLLISICVQVQAERIIVSSGKGVVYPQYENRIDWLVMMHDITASSEIAVVLTDPSHTVNWFRYPDLQFVSNQTSISPDDHTGYLVRISGLVNGQSYNQEMTVWVIDYKLHLPVFNALIPDNPHQDNCNQLKLTVDGQIPEMFYTTPLGLKYNLKRDFSLHYETLAWNDSWVAIEVNVPVEVDNNVFTIDNPPYKDTYFTLSGDQFAHDLNISLSTIKSNLYAAIRVISKIKTEATVRTEKHEGDRPESITAISGSAPLEINFTANANVPVANYYKWEIFSGDEPFITRTGDNHRFTFTEAGTYLVKLTTENMYCTHTDSLTIRVSESAIYAPNVFTPNGDGINDEFRVAYKSIIEFQCWVFNRWGSKVFQWSDPQKGWDGNINGKPANEGAYFYVIKALGSDGIKYHLKGDINLLRGKQ